MKTLLIFRHGKTEKDAPGGDKERGLTGRGERDSAAMARYLDAVAPRPARVVASDARRAQQTAQIVVSTLGLAEGIQTDPEIYAASLTTLLRVVRRLPDEAACVLLVGHNPGLEALGQDLAAEGTAGRHLATAGVVHLEFDAPRWKDVRPGTGRLRGIYDPEELPAAESGARQ